AGLPGARARVWKARDFQPELHGLGHTHPARPLATDPGAGATVGSGLVLLRHNCLAMWECRELGDRCCALSPCGRGHESLPTNPEGGGVPPSPRPLPPPISKLLTLPLPLPRRGRGRINARRTRGCETSLSLGGRDTPPAYIGHARRPSIRYHP